MRILLVKTSSLGDVIHNLPVATDLARMQPGIEIDWCVEDNYASIPGMHPAVHRVIPVAVRRWRKHPLSPSTWRELRAFRAELRAASYDLIVDTQGLVKSALLTRWAHGRRVGYDSDSIREPLASRFYHDQIAVPRELHAVQRNRLLAAQAVGYRIEDQALDYGLAPQPYSPPWLPNAPYAVCFSATSRDDKLWPEDSWRSLLSALRRRGITAVMPTGGPAERFRAERIAVALDNVIVPPPLGLRKLAGIIRGAQLAIGVDTGLTHLAAALNVPTVALYTATEPGLTGVFGGGRHVNLGGRDQCPSADEVRSAIDAVLA